MAIGLAIWSRQVYLSLAAGVWLGWIVEAGWNPAAGFARAVEATVRVGGDPGNLQVLMFTFGIGALIAVVRANGGIRGFVEWLERRRWVTSGRRAQLLAWVTGLVIFIESNITILVAGSVARPLFDRFRVSREKLAYLVDSTSAPVCILIPFNAWGAYVLSLLAGLGVEQPVSVFVGSMPLNFYALGAIVLAGITVLTGLDLGPMARAEARTREGKLHWDHASALADPDDLAPAPDEDMAHRPVNMLLPVAVMVATMPLGMYVTGGGELAEGSGATSVLWAVLAGLAAAWILSAGQGLLEVDELSDVSLKGAGGLTGMAAVLLLALTLGDVTRVLGTGEYVAGAVTGALHPAAILPLTFVVAGGIAFATGSSWGTFAIMLPVAVPLASAGLALPALLAATLSGGIFGDHCSPISDTTIISSMASASDHIEHVRTQLPYAMTAGAAAAAGFALVGLLG